MWTQTGSLEAEEEVLAVRVDAGEGPAVEQGGAVGELALGAADAHRAAREAVVVVGGEAVDRVPLGHGVCLLGLRPSPVGVAECVRRRRTASRGARRAGAGRSRARSRPEPGRLSPAAGGGPGSGGARRWSRSAESMSMRRVWRSSPEYGVARKISTNFVDSSTRVHPAADGHHVGVVVLAAERGGLLAPGERGAHALDLVRGDLLAVAGAADDDAEAVRVRGRPLGGTEAERRVVVLGVVDVGTAVDGLVAVGREPLDEVVLQFEAGMVGAEVHAHGAKCGTDAGGVIVSGVGTHRAFPPSGAGPVLCARPHGQRSGQGTG